MTHAHADQARSLRSAMGSKKRNVSVLIPYRFKNGELKIFLQKRTLDAPTFPNHFGFFGGGIEEGEDPEKALRREIKEELNIDIQNHIFWRSYDLDTGILHVSTIQVDETFEDSIQILEGQYGSFLTWADLEKEMISAIDKPIIIDFLKTYKDSAVVKDF